MKDELCIRDKWVSVEHYQRMFAVYQVITPGVADCLFTPCIYFWPPAIPVCPEDTTL